MSIIAISGSRTFTDTAVVHGVIDKLLAHHHKIVIGDAPSGVDLIAWEYLKTLPRARYTRMEADWRPNGKLDRSAGHKRNGRMVAVARGLVAIYAPGMYTPGTSNCVGQAMSKRIPIRIYHEGAWISG